MLSPCPMSMWIMLFWHQAGGRRGGGREGGREGEERRGGRGKGGGKEEGGSTKRNYMQMYDKSETQKNEESGMYSTTTDLTNSHTQQLFQFIVKIS